MRQDLTATKSFTYAGRALKAGDPFSARRADARALCAAGRAALVSTYQTTEATALVTKEVAKDVTKVPPAPAAAAVKKPAARRADVKKSALQKADDK